MKRIIYLVVALICAASVNVINAQVRIGNNTEPHKGAVLDLKSTETETKGLLLPSVNLTDINAFLPVTGNKDEAAGMVIYNTNETIGKGVYVWDGEKWSKIADSNGNGGDNGGGTGTPATELPKVTITSDKTPASITAGTAVGLTATVTTEGSNTYQWYKNGTVISNATSNTYSIASIAFGDQYSCVVTNSQGSATAYWSTCGAATVDGGWLVFMCHNLGADESLDPFVHNEGLYGDLYQWGRPTDGHEKRDSKTTNVLATSNIPQHANFITVSTAPHDWRSGGGNTSRWGNGTTNVNPPKAANDPCPSGWKVPSQSQWASIYQGGNSHGHPDAAIANNWSWTGNGFKVGVSLYLPAAGVRGSGGNGFAVLGHVGGGGFYWSSTIASTSSYYLIVDNTYVDPTDSIDGRVQGMSVRCVADN